MDDEGEPALAPPPVGVEDSRFETGVDDHVEQVVVGEPTATDQGLHHRLEHGRGHGDGEGLRDAVQHHVHAAVPQLGQPFLGDGGADQGLAGEVLQAEADELVVRRHHDVGIPGGLAGQRGAEPGARRLDPRLHHAREQMGRPQGRGHGQPEQGVVGDLGRQVEAQERVGELDVVGELPEQPRGPGVVEAPEHHRARIGEIAGQLGLQVPDGPLLQHVPQCVAVADGRLGRRLLDRVDGVELTVVQATARASRTPVTAIASARGPQELTRLRAASTSPEVPTRTSRKVRSRNVTTVSWSRSGPVRLMLTTVRSGGLRHLRPSPSSRSRRGGA